LGRENLFDLVLLLKSILKDFIVAKMLHLTTTTDLPRCFAFDKGNPFDALLSYIVGL